MAINSKSINSRTRSVKSVKDELIKKSRESILAAVQIYNNPQITFKSETFITLSIISWTYLLHAYYRSEGIDYRYYKAQGKRKIFDKTRQGADKYWELEKCLDYPKSPLDNSTTANLKFLIGIRHEIEHQMTNKIDEYISAKLQACAINYNYYVQKLFGDKYSVSKDLAISIQFSEISSDQQKQLISSDKLTTNIKNYIFEFENQLSEVELKNIRYAYRVLYTPITVNRKGQADQVIEFVKAESTMANEIERVMIKETERTKYRPGEIVDQMQKEGFVKFRMNHHTDLWKNNDAQNPNKGFGTTVSKQWYWYSNWLEFVRQHCENKSEYYK